VTREQVAIIALTGLVLIVGVAGLVADRGRRQWAARCAERTAERDALRSDLDEAAKRYEKHVAEFDRMFRKALDQRDQAHDLIADMLPHLKHAGASPGLKRRAADLLDGT
jgi:hypothetical protein